MEPLPKSDRRPTGATVGAGKKRTREDNLKVLLYVEQVERLEHKPG